MRIVYTVDEWGWAKAVVEHGDQRRKMRVSYLTNAPLDMIEAAIAVLGGAELAEFTFHEEPATHEWRIEAGETSEDVLIRVLWFEDDFAKERGETGTEVFRCQSTRRAFAEAIRECLGAVFQKHGMKYYKRRWLSEEFPIQELQELERLLALPIR